MLPRLQGYRPAGMLPWALPAGAGSRCPSGGSARAGASSQPCDRCQRVCVRVAARLKRVPARRRVSVEGADGDRGPRAEGQHHHAWAAGAAGVGAAAVLHQPGHAQGATMGASLPDVLLAIARASCWSHWLHAPLWKGRVGGRMNELGPLFHSTFTNKLASRHASGQSGWGAPVNARPVGVGPEAAREALCTRL